MKRLLPLLLSVLLLASCASTTPPGPGSESASSDRSTTPVMVYDPSPVEGDPSEELVMSVVGNHPRLASVDPYIVMVAEDGYGDLLGLVIFEHPEAVLGDPLEMAAVTRDRIFAVSTHAYPEFFMGMPSDYEYHGDGLFSFVFTDAASGNVYDCTASIKMMDGSPMSTLDFVLRTEDGGASSSQG